MGFVRMANGLGRGHRLGYGAPLHGTNRRRGLGSAVNTAGLVSTGSAVATSAVITSLANSGVVDAALGTWAGPIGAGVGALVGIVAGLFAASAARAKGAKTENAAINEYLPSWDAAMSQIFAAANAGTSTPAQCIAAIQQIMAAWWQAAAQFHGLPGVADNSGGGANCGSYTSGTTPPCSPGHPCSKSCTAFCCVGCNDLWTSSLDAIRVFNSPTGGTVNVCTVYGSGYGATQRSGYSLTYTPPAAGTVAGATSTVGAALSSVTSGLVGTDSTGATTILGLPWYLVVGGGVAAYLAFRR